MPASSAFRAGEPPRPPQRFGRLHRAAARARAVLVRLAALARPARTSQRIWLVGLAGLDVAAIALFLAYAHAEHYALRDSLFYGDVRFSFVDGGYPERYGYAKQALIAALLLAAWRARRQPVLAALALLFTVTMLDDALTLHETLGPLLAARAGLAPRAGELAAWALIGLVPLLLVLAAYRESDASSRADAEAVLAGFAVLLFFAVGMDAVHGLVGRRVEGFQTLLTIAEDGGELVALTLLCMLALGIHARAR